MLHPKTIYRRRIVISDLLLLSVKPHTLPDERLVRFARRAPDREGHLKADDQPAALAEVARARSERVLVVQLVAAR